MTALDVCRPCTRCSLARLLAGSPSGFMSRNKGNLDRKRPATFAVSGLFSLSMFEQCIVFNNSLTNLMFFIMISSFSKKN